MTEHAVQKPRTYTFGRNSDAQNSPDAHISLYEKYLDVSPYIAQRDERLTRATLWHRDLRAPNIFVKDGRITSLIDWQSAWAGPLLLQYRYPGLVRYGGEVMSKLPEKYEDLEQSEQNRISRQVERSLVQYSYEVDIRSRTGCSGR